jgi:alkylhydroperoxidase family enzyme
LSEEKIAALDSDWKEFTAAERTAFDFTRRLTNQPHTLTDAHLTALAKHYKPLQILEIIFTVANNNSTTRWTDTLAIPLEQEGAFFARGKPKVPDVLNSFLTPTAEAFTTCRSSVAPLALSARPALCTRGEAEKHLAACRKRKPRLPLVDEDKARALLPRDWPPGPLPQWVRLLANFPKAGPPKILGLRAAEEKGTLDKRLRAKVWWIAARQDRAWYALGQARARLLHLKVSEKEIWSLDGAWDGCSAGERAAFSLARKVTATPHKITDDDIAVLRKHYSDGEVAELVYQLCTAAFFDRLTEAAGLQLENRE